MAASNVPYLEKKSQTAGPGDQQLAAVGHVQALEPRHKQHASGGEPAGRALCRQLGGGERSHEGLRGSLG